MTLLQPSPSSGLKHIDSHPATGTSSTPPPSVFTDEDHDLPPIDTSWRSNAACIGHTDLFFSPHTCWTDCPEDCQAGRSEEGRFERIKAAKAMCNGAAAVPPSELYPHGMPERQVCPVRDECLEWAIETRYSIGFIGGKSERERKLLAKARATTGARQ